MTGRRAAGWAGCALAMLLLTGCTSAPGPQPLVERPTPDDAARASDPGVRDAVERVLERRARAIETGDRSAFRATVAPGPGGRRQLAAFSALREFPVQGVAYRLGTPDPAAAEDRYVAEVEMLVRLRRFDPAAVPTQHRMELVRDDTGRWRVVRDHVDRSQVGFAPWLLPGVTTYVGDRLLIAFDSGSARHRERFVRLAEAAMDQVVSDVPLDWRRTAVILAPSRTSTLRAEGFDPVEISRLGGVAYPVRGPDQQVTGRRVVMAPVMLAATDVGLETVLAHELAHVALVREDDDAVPVWVSEGLAEYVAHQGDPVVYLGNDTIARARSGVDQMPPDGLFHAGDWGLSYGLSWFAMQVVAQREGPEEPYALLEAIRKADPADFREVSALVEERYGLTTDELAAEAAELIAATFG